MISQTAKGLKISFNVDQFTRQDKIDYGHKVLYRLYRTNGSFIDLNSPIGQLECNYVDLRPKFEKPSAGPILKATELIDLNKCPSAGGVFNATKKQDEFVEEKYKGEAFFTHKSSSGLVIKKDGKIIHETKMSDMYKRRG
jgi:hypothetical protein